MKKVLVTVFAAFVMGLFALTASAEDDVLTSYEAMNLMLEFDEAVSDIPDSLRGEALEEAYAEALAEIGWSMVEAPTPRSWDIDPELLELAYSDLDSATPEMKTKIRMARYQVMYNPKVSGWTVGCETITGVQDINNKVFFISPRFEDLFPGWELPGADFEKKIKDGMPALAAYEKAQSAPAEGASPVAPAVDEKAADVIASVLDAIEAVGRAGDEVVISWSGTINLYHPHPTMITAPFCTVPALETGRCTFRVWANLFANATSVNYGCRSTGGRDFGYQAGLGLNEKAPFYVYTVSSVEMRASTNGPEGSCYTIVQRKKESGM